MNGLIIYNSQWSRTYFIVNHEAMFKCPTVHRSKLRSHATFLTSMLPVTLLFHAHIVLHSHFFHPYPQARPNSSPLSHCRLF